MLTVRNYPTRRYKKLKSCFLRGLPVVRNAVVFSKISVLFQKITEVFPPAAAGLDRKPYICATVCRTGPAAASVMEQLLHYVWLHRLFPLHLLRTTGGQEVEVIDPGLHNTDAGPDFFNAKVRIGGTLWVGSVEIHRRSSDWLRHGHSGNPAYANVILHVVETADTDLPGTDFPQLELPVPPVVRERYEALRAEEAFPPCYRVVPGLDGLKVADWLGALCTERLEEKTARIADQLKACGNDWEQVCFMTLARNFGFGVNGEAFGEWAEHIPLHAVGKHRDDLFQVEAFFFGQAGLLTEEGQPMAHRVAASADSYYLKLQAEYRFLAHKFGLQPMDARRWRFLRLRPQNFPHIRLAQLACVYHRQVFGLSRLLEADGPEALRRLLATGVSPYWETHYGFGCESRRSAKQLQTASLNLLLINTVAPLFFAYGRYRSDEALCEKAFGLWESLPAESNYITRSWQAAGLSVRTAADSQALIRLRKHYCDRRDCLRCRFGYEYLTHKKP